MRWVLILVALLPLAAVAGGYRWTDENGNVHYSDKPPPGSESTEEIEMKGPEPIGQGEGVQRTRRELEKMREEREKREREAAREKARREQQRLRECQRRARLLAEMKNKPVRYKQEDGTYRGVDQDTHQARIREMEEWLDAHCKD